MLSSRSLAGVAAGGSSHALVSPPFTPNQCRLHLSQTSSSSNQHHRQPQSRRRRRQQGVVAAAAKGFGSSKAKVTSSKANSRAAQKCPCGSGQPYQSCCGRYHTGAALAPTPEALLRARFSAYKLQLVDYLVATTHKDNPEHTGDPVTYARSVQRTARGVEYLSLNLMDLPEQQLQQLLQQKAASSSGGGSAGDDDGFLRFSVRWRPRTPGVAATEEVATETSHFKRVNGAWQYFGMLE